MPGRLTPHRVFMTTDAVGGVWSYTLDLARGFAESGIGAMLAVLGPRPDASQQGMVPAGVGFICTDLPLDWTAASPTELGDVSRALKRMASEFGADTAHLHAPALVGHAAWSMPVVAVAHSCVGTWWRSVRAGPLPPDLAWRHEATGSGLHCADAVIAPSHAFAGLLRAAHAAALGIRVVHNGRRMIAAGPRRDSGPIVLTAGRLWDEGKNIAVLDASARLLGVPLVAAGPLQRPDGAVRAFPHLRTPGALSEAELGALYARASLFVSAALYEPFGLAVLEAAMAELPLVLSDIASFRELWEGAAVFCPPHDPQAIASAIRGLLNDAAERSALGAAAASRARRYTAERMTAATLAVHRDALARRRRQAA
jgi:glycosyltransferase involved in cell wall biosynthesis